MNVNENRAGEEEEYDAWVIQKAFFFLIWVMKSLLVQPIYTSSSYLIAANKKNYIFWGLRNFQQMDCFMARR